MSDEFEAPFNERLRVIDAMIREGVYSKDMTSNMKVSQKRAIAASRMLESHLTTFASMWESGGIPQQDLYFYFEASFAKNIDECVRVCRALTQPSQDTFDAIFSLTERLSVTLKACKSDAVGEAIIMCLIGAMVFAQTQSTGLDSKFIMRSCNVDEQFLRACIQKSGAKFDWLHDVSLQPNCRTIAARLTTLNRPSDM